MLAYVLNKNIDSQKLLSDIQQLINSSMDNSQDLILTIQIKPISQTDDTLIPKIEHKT